MPPRYGGSNLSTVQTVKILIAGYSNPPADLKFFRRAACERAPRRLSAQKRTSIPRLRHGAGESGQLPQPTQRARITRALCVGWGSWIRTSENARVKVWCLTAWLYPNYLIDLWYYITFSPICQELFLFFLIFFFFCLIYAFLGGIFPLFWLRFHVFFKQSYCYFSKNSV